MKRETLLTISVVLLLVLNVGILSYIFLSRNNCAPLPPPVQMQPPPPPEGMPPPPMRPDMLIRETLKLSDEQDKKYVASIEVHHSGMMRLDSEYRVVAEEYFKLLQAKNASSVNDSLVKKLGAIQAEKAAITYRHLEEIKAFCTPEQIVKFDSIVPDIVRMLLMPAKRMPPDHGFPPPPPRRK